MNTTRSSASLPEENGHPKLRKLKAAKRLILTAVLVTLAFAASETASAKDQISSPSSFKLDYDAQIASDGHDLWLATVGKSPGKKYKIQVQRKKSDGWVTLPGRPTTNMYTALRLAAYDAPGEKRSVPCVGDSAKNHGRVRCLVDGDWQSVPLSDKLKGLSLSGLDAHGSTLTALFYRWDKNLTTTVQVARLENGRFVPFGPALKRDGQVMANLGEQTSDAKYDGIDVALQLSSGEDPGQRILATVDGKDWQTSDLPKLDEGPQLSGPVRTADSVYFPAVQFFAGETNSSSRWPLSVYRQDQDRWARVGGGPARKHGGMPQGGIDAVGNRIWVTWDLTVQGGKDPDVQSIEYAARVSPDGKKYDQKIKLWAGKAIGPGVNQAVEYKNGPAFLYMRRLGSGRPRATVDLSHG